MDDAEFWSGNNTVDYVRALLDPCPYILEAWQLIGLS